MDNACLTTKQMQEPSFLVSGSLLSEPVLKALSLGYNIGLFSMGEPNT